MIYRFKHTDKIEELTSKLLESYKRTPKGMDHLDSAELPSRSEVTQIIHDLMSILFPGYYGPRRPQRKNLPYFLGARLEQIYEKLTLQIYLGLRHRCCIENPACKHCEELAEGIAIEFFESLPYIRDLLALDVQAAFEGDPAAKSFDEIIFCYPGIFAIALYRMANKLHTSGALILPRFMTEYAHHHTGCDIHPGARIGKSFFIDHATGVVIGETSDIGEHVRIYQGVTLGSLRFPRDENGKIIRDRKRHPTLEDNVVVYAGATILGGDTVIGKGAVIAGNTWVIESVPPGTKVLQKTKRYKPS